MDIFPAFDLRDQLRRQLKTAPYANAVLDECQRLLFPCSFQFVVSGQE